MVTLRKWYFAANEQALRTPGTRALMETAIRSCRQHTNLEPHLLHCGAPHPALDEFRRLGVRVIRHTPSLRDALRPAYGDDFAQFQGHWLRFDIPDIEGEDDFVLYTDIDVVFQRLPETLRAPEFLAVSPQLERRQRKRFNTGVMIMNLPRLRPLWPAFRAAVLHRLANNFVYPGHDEPSFNAFFAHHISWLPDEMNWRPFWGFTPRANIIHFHGPKPGLIRTFQKTTTQPRQKQLFELFQRDTAAYARFLAIYDGVAAGDVLTTAPVRDTHLVV